MGQVHARALTRLLQHYPETSVRPRMVAVADTATDQRTERGMAAFGFERRVTDWRELVAMDDLDLVCVTGPNFIHRDVAVAAAEHGHHLWVEKPAGRDSAETREIAAAVDEAGVQCAAGFNYRNAPAVEHAKELVVSGRLGRVQHTVVRFRSDYSAHPDGALSWRFRNEYAGSGVLGDLMSHAADLARYVGGDLSALVADTATFVAERPQARGAASHFSRGGDGPRLPVENEDYASALVQLADGSRGVLQASRTEVGEQCAYEIEVHGTQGALSWDFRRMGELRVCLDQDYQDAAYSTLLVNPAHGELGAFQPGSGIAMSYDDLKVIEAYEFLRSIAEGVPHGADVEDAVRCGAVLDAIAESAASGRRVEVPDR
jgi:predicted dehydrogenase